MGGLVSLEVDSFLPLGPRYGMVPLMCEAESFSSWQTSPALYHRSLELPPKLSPGPPVVPTPLFAVWTRPGKIPPPPEDLSSQGFYGGPLKRP